MLKPYAGCGDYSCYNVVVSARKLDKLVSDADDKGQDEKLDKHTDNDCGLYSENDMIQGVYKERDEDAHKYHKNEEACSASGMESSLISDVFNGKLKSCLVAENSFMFCSVELEGAADVLHKDHKRHISDDNDQLECALDYRLDK